MRVLFKKQELKSTIILVLPLMAAFMAQKGMQFIDTLMMGWIGPAALAAAALGTSIFMTVTLFCVGTLSAVGVFIVRARGANNALEIQSSVQHGFCIALLLSLPCMLITWFVPYLLQSISEDPLVVKNVLLLLHGLTWGLPGFLLFLVMREFFAAFSLTTLIMLVALGSLPLTFFVNYLLMYGTFGFPALGIAGIGYGGAFIMWFMFLCLLAYSRKKHHLKKYISFASLQFDTQKIKELLSMGIPSGMLVIFESGLFLFAALIMGYFGVNALAAQQIAIQCASIVYTLPLALSIATSLQVGYALGEKDIQKARRMVFLGFILGLIITLLIALIFIMAPAQLAGLFLKGEEQDYHQVMQLATSFLIIAAFFQCSDAIQSIANGALRGLKDTFVPMLISIGCYWFFGMGGAYYFAFYMHLGPIGIWYGFVLGLTSIALVLSFRLFNRLRYLN